jgi:hypothetical protein
MGSLSGMRMFMYFKSGRSSKFSAAYVTGIWFKVAMSFFMIFQVPMCLERKIATWVLTDVGFFTGMNSKMSFQISFFIK